MPFSAVYAKYYGLGSSDPFLRTDYPFTAGNTPSGGTFLYDTQDGTDDGTIAIGAEVDWSSAIGTQTLVGVTDAGYPVIFSTHSNLYYVLTPDINLAAQPFSMVSTSYTMCFGAGSLIKTPRGEQTVETLKRGDTVFSASGKVLPVLWIGQKVCHHWVNGDAIQPVRIRAGALGNGCPTRDLVVTGDHGLVLDGVVVNASALVNGWSIIWEPMSNLDDIVIYYHIETENHDIVIANGAAAETFIDAATRCNFDNYDEFLALYGADRKIQEMDIPRVSSRRLLPLALRKKLEVVAAHSVE